MTRVRFLFLIMVLGCTYCPAAWATTSSEAGSELLSSQANSDTRPLPQEEQVLLPTEKSQPTLADPVTSNKQRESIYLAETMRMQRAWIYSAMVPGWGQVYNEHYWKVPAMYALFGALGGGAVYNHQAALSYPPGVAKEYAEKSRDLCIIFIGLLYIANIFDAYVGASLKTFNLSDDIIVGMQPSLTPVTQDGPVVGLSLTFNF